MRKLSLIIVSLSCFISSFSQTIIQKDPAIEKMVKEVSADSLQSYIKSLVAFGTRSTISTQTDPKRGIGAARLWVLGKFNEFAKQSGGRLTAMIDTTTLPADGKRIDAPLVLGNVVATLKGTDPNDNRIFLISGHMDSRRTNVMDKTGDAPGANNAGSPGSRTGHVSSGNRNAVRYRDAARSSAELGSPAFRAIAVGGHNAAAGQRAARGDRTGADR